QTPFQATADCPADLRFGAARTTQNAIGIAKSVGDLEPGEGDTAGRESKHVAKRPTDPSPCREQPVGIGRRGNSVSSSWSCSKKRGRISTAALSRGFQAEGTEVGLGTIDEAAVLPEMTNLSPTGEARRRGRSGTARADRCAIGKRRGKPRVAEVSADRTPWGATGGRRRARASPGNAGIRPDIEA